MCFLESLPCVLAAAHAVGLHTAIITIVFSKTIHGVIARAVEPGGARGALAPPNLEMKPEGRPEGLQNESVKLLLGFD